jgi:hypothetical protein
MSETMLDRNAQIPSEEVRQDIRDTEREIADLTREEAGLRMIGDKLSVFRADARASGIRERAAFIVKLKALLSARGESP